MTDSRASTMAADTQSSTAGLPRQDLTDKVAVVTHTTKGVGRALAYNLALRGCSILGTYSSTSDDHHFHTLSHNVSSTHSGPGSGPSHSHTGGPKMVGVAADASSADFSTTIITSLEKNFSGKLDILINSAAPATKVSQEDEEERVPRSTYVQKTLASNIQTPILLVEELVSRDMFQRNSKIINVTQDLGDSGSVFYATMCAMEGLTRAWARELGDSELHEGMRGMTTNAVKIVRSDRKEEAVGDVTNVVGLCLDEREGWNGKVVAARWE